MHYSRYENEQTACVSAFNQAHEILVRLSAYKSVAKRALKALNGVVKKWGRGNTTGNSGGANAGVRQSEVGDCNVRNLSPYLQTSVVCCAHASLFLN